MTPGSRAGTGAVSKRRASTAIWAGASAQLAAVVWILQWAHALVAHGPTQLNQKQLWLGMTWMDSGKFIAPAFLLLIPAVLFIGQRAQTAGSRRTRTFGMVVIGVLVAAAIGTALEFGLFQWGSYQDPAGTWGTLASLGGPFGALSRGVFLPLAWVLFGTSAVRGQAMPAWLVPPLVLGSVFTFFLAGPLPPVPGIVWLAFGAWLLTQTHTQTAADRD